MSSRFELYDSYNKAWDSEKQIEDPNWPFDYVINAKFANKHRNYFVTNLVFFHFIYTILIAFS